MTIRMAESDVDIARCFSVMAELRPDVTEGTFVARVRELARGGYGLAFVEDDGSVRAVAGFRVGDMLHRGRHMYVDDLVTTERARSMGHGTALLRWLMDHARSLGCGQIHLDSGVQRHSAHRFYFREGMHVSSFHFTRPL